SRRRAAIRKSPQKKQYYIDDFDDFDDDETLDEMLSGKLEAVGIGVYLCLEECESTNDKLKEEAKSIIAFESKSRLKEPGSPMSREDRIQQMLLPPAFPFVLSTERQTSGRGRGNNRWWSGDGSLAMSMLLESQKHHLRPQTSAHLALGVGYAVMNAIRTIVNQAVQKTSDKATSNMPKVEIRWPNDVYVNDRKIAGILIEVPTQRHTVIGIGVNTNCTAADAPAELRDRVMTLRDILQMEINQRDFIYELCREVMTMLDYFPSKLPELIAEIEKELTQTGKNVCIKQQGEFIEGICLGINADGSLRVQTPQGERAVVSGVLSD
ncbi:MAG: biotin--[acetyl-CoA-carboxylase] ligase, partial [Planctomycetaceae bacterium]|nr:biotin--[acetyl-CoA-carboxylase] ligase [Planctomycetaceae bacterium]